MNQASSRQRKMAYLVGILVLLVPIIGLGMPSGGQAGGGALARMRSNYDLGESNLGQVDPTSATMNLVLLGLRGIAVNILRMDLDYYKDHKEWSKMRSTTKSVILLQPHYIEVWRFLSWNLSYNVSAEWDAVPERFHWVKEGGKFAQEGCERNRDNAELLWDVGKTWSQKIGRSDEWRYFRKYFVKDPDEKTFKGQADPEINPEQKDNYLVARDWFTNANDKETRRGQHIMMRALFRSYPPKSLLDFADALQRDAKYEPSSEVIQDKFNRARSIFEEGYNEWVNKYGKERFKTSRAEVYMEADENDVAQMAKDNGLSAKEIQREILFFQNTTNYRYWRERGRSERLSDTAEAHRLLYEGERLYKAGKLAREPNTDKFGAQEVLEEGMAKYAKLLESFTELRSEDLTVEEGMWAVMLWRKALDLQGKPVPDNYALKSLWDEHQGVVPSLQDRFNSMGY